MLLLRFFNVVVVYYKVKITAESGKNEIKFICYTAQMFI